MKITRILLKFKKKIVEGKVKRNREAKKKEEDKKEK